MPSVGTVLTGYLCSISMASRSTLGSNWIRLNWYRGGSIVNVCLLSSARKFVEANIESGVSRSILPSLVCSI